MAGYVFSAVGWLLSRRLAATVAGSDVSVPWYGDLIVDLLAATDVVDGEPIKRRSRLVALICSLRRRRITWWLSVRRSIDDCSAERHG